MCYFYKNLSITALRTSTHETLTKETGKKTVLLMSKTRDKFH